MHALRIAPVFPIVALLSVSGGCGPVSSGNNAATTDSVVQWRVPDGGRLPHAVIDDEGTTHLIYVQGEPVEGDLMYVTRGPDASTWSEPTRVNSEYGTVTGIGPIDGGHLALGRDNRLHVTWFRISPVEFFYTRTSADGAGVRASVRSGHRFRCRGGINAGGRCRRQRVHVLARRPGRGCPPVGVCDRIAR